METADKRAINVCFTCPDPYEVTSCLEKGLSDRSRGGLFSTCGPHALLFIRPSLSRGFVVVLTPGRAVRGEERG